MDLNPDQLPLVQGDEFLPSISPWATLGGGALVVTFGAAVALSSVLNYNVTVKAPGTIRPAGELRIIQAGVEGGVKSIEVKENQVVKEGQVIAYLDDSRLQTQKSQLQSGIQQGQLQLGQIDAQLNSLDTQILAESNLVNRSITAAQAGLEGNQRDYRDRQTTTQANVVEAAVALNVARAQKERLRYGKELRATLQEAETSLKLAKVQRDRLKQIVGSGAVSRNQFEEKELAVQLAETKLEQVRAAAQDQFDEKELAVTTAAAKLQRAKTTLDPSDATVRVAAKQIDQEQARGEATIATLNQQRQTLLQRRIEQQNQLNQTQKQLQQVEADLDGSIVRAPTAGTVLQLQLRNQGQIVGPGAAIAYIAPLNAPLIIKAQVPSQDITKVKPGQNVQIRVSACPYPDYGTLKGTVKTVAPDALPPASAGTGAPPSPASYEVIIQPHTMFVGDGEHQCRLQSGMEGRADIISRAETVLKFVLRKAKLITNF